MTRDPAAGESPGAAAVVAALALVATVAGCAIGRLPDPRYATAEGRKSLGRIGYVTGNFEPERRAVFLKRNKWHGAGFGIGSGVMACGEGLANGGEIGVVLWLLVSPVCGLVGGVAGAVSAAPADAVRRADAQLKRELKRLNPNVGLQAALAAHVAALGLDLRELPSAQGPGDPNVLPAYDPALRAIADTVLEATVLRVDTYSNGDEELAVQLRLRARLRLVALARRAGDANRVLDEIELAYGGEPRAAQALASGAAQIFDRQMSQAYESIIEQAGRRWPLVLGQAPLARSGG